MGCCCSSTAQGKAQSLRAKAADPVDVVFVHIKRGLNIQDAEYRIGDVAEKFMGMDKIKLKVRVSWGKDAVGQTKPVVVKDGGAEIDEVLIFKAPPGSKTLCFTTYDEEGMLQDIFRGDPLVGAGSLTLDDSAMGKDRRVRLERSGAEKGELVVSVTAGKRAPKQILLCKSKCLFKTACNFVDSDKWLACHWGAALVNGPDECLPYELTAPSFPAGGPIGVMGLRGMIAYSDASDYTWTDGKNAAGKGAGTKFTGLEAFVRAIQHGRTGQGLVSEEAQKKLQEEDITKLDDWMTCFPCRALNKFDDRRLVGETFYNEEEIDAFVKKYIDTNPEYHCLSNSCQT